MKKLLNDYAAFVKDLLKKNGAEDNEVQKFHDLAVDANDDPYWQKDPNQRGKKW